MNERKIVKQVMKENKEGLQRLANEEPAKEKRNPLKKLKRKIEDLFTEEQKVGYIST